MRFVQSFAYRLENPIVQINWYKICTLCFNIVLLQRGKSEFDTNPHLKKTITILLVVLLAAVSASAQLNTDRLTAIGRNAMYFEDYVVSIQYFNQVIRLKPYLAEPYLLRAIAKIQLQDYTGALDDCDKSIERNPFQHGAYYTRGYVLRQLHRYSDSENDFTQALTFSPENKTYMMLRADVRASQKDYTGAMQDIDYLLNREPKNASVLFEKGIVCMQQTDTLCARNAFEQTVKYDSQNAGNWSALGLTYLYLGEDDKALDCLNRSIDLGSHWAGDYINRGILHYRRHNYRGALADLDEAVSLNPQDAGCYYNRGLLRAEVGDLNRAVDDLNQAIELAPDQVDMHYQRGVVQLKLGQWKEAAEDFQILIDRYPYFLPSYYLAAQAHTALGEKKTAFTLRQTAYTLEQRKDSLQAAMSTAKDSLPNTEVMTAQARPKRKDPRKEFSARIAEGSEVQETTEYTSETRGSVQKRYTDVVNEPNVGISYYSQNTDKALYHYIIADYNRSRHLPADISLTITETSLTPEMVNTHFEHITALTERINKTPSADLNFARAIEFAMVQDYASAIDDCTAALTLLKGKTYDAAATAIYTFCRANWRFKLLEYQLANGEIQTRYEAGKAAGKAEMDFDIMLRDYDYVLQLQPDFAYAAYNKAGMLCIQKNYKDAIAHYSIAIDRQPDFAQAYFNRGLTYIYIGEQEKGIQDLSKAGELGIYKAYNLITRFQ